MAIDILCPACGGKTSTRSSEEFGPFVKKAKLVCRNCGRHSHATVEITQHYDLILVLNTEIHKLSARPIAANDNDINQLSLKL